jgi:tetratricopeptide (TPR) repeat protein
VPHRKERNRFDSWEIEAALAKIVSDADFKKNLNSTQFLKFVVEETLAGRGERLKGFTIATSALGRNSDFDPQSSSLVRVQANRLRRLLADYYLGLGAQDPVRIVLPLGSYQPQFERHAAAAPASPTEDRSWPTRSERENARPRSWWIAAIAAFAMGLTVGGAALLVRRSLQASVVAEHSPLTHAPIVVVENANDETAAKDANEAAQRAVAAVENGLSVFDHFVVRRRTKSTERGDIDYALSVATKPSGDGAASDFTFQLAHLPTNEIVWSRTFSQIGRDDSASIDGMTEAVVAAVGELHMGAIMADQRRRTVTSHSPMRGYACLLEAYDYLLSRDSEKRGPARECLERQLSLDPQDPHALTLLSIILVIGYTDLLPDSLGPVDIERAESLAQRAFEISPYRSETSTMLFLSRFYAGRFDDAFGLAPRLLENTANARLVSANIGVAYVLRGRYDDGMAILFRLEETSLEAPAMSAAMMALAAYMRDDETTAERFASRTVAARLPIGLAIRIAVCQREANQACVLAASKQLRETYPDFAAAVPTGLARHALADDIRAKLLADLTAAGFFSEASR